MLPAAALRELLGRAAVYAATSRYEPFGLAPLEAVLAGCALVMTDIPTFRELWEGCALFYPPGDAAALASACRELLQDPHHRQALARAAGERARECYNPGRMAAGYEALYRRIIA
jgi:glycosyltransferase involved in cell wall biosynthesis